ncbi:hypothetical protein RLIN73S_00582 [Rhodanobacter lindaniclasticus]
MPSAKVSVTSDKPYSDTERLVTMPGMAFMPSSTGTVISRSTSSAECPGHCVTRSTIGGDRFGYASIGKV